MEYLERRIAEISWDTLYNKADTVDEANFKSVSRQHIFGSADLISLGEYEKMAGAQPTLSPVHLKVAKNVVDMLKKERFIFGVQ